MNWLKKLFSRETGELKFSDMKAVVDELNSELLRIKSAGTVDGDHYTDYVEQVKELKRDNRLPEAIELLIKLVDATESEARAAGEGRGVAPWYYEQLAIIYRKEKRFNDEVSILERYDAQPKAPGVGPSKLAARLSKVRELVSL